MSRFVHLMQEDIEIRRYVEMDMMGGKVYDPPEDTPPAIIKGRREYHRAKIINNKGEEAISEAVVYTPARLSPGDLVIADGREWPVQSVSERKGLYGKTDHWEVRL